MVKGYKIIQNLETNSAGKFIVSKNGQDYCLVAYNNSQAANHCYEIASFIYSEKGKDFIQKYEARGKYYVLYRLYNFKVLPDIINLNLTLQDKIQFIIELIKALKEVHQKKYIFNNLTLSGSCLYNSDKIFLTNFQFASIKNKPAEGETGLNLINPYYISPELTGKINIPVSIQSDFYALGIVMYKLFTGAFPFESEDISELHAMHIARIPPEPVDINKQIPENLSKIILKLLEKNPKQRYKSHHGINYDLERIYSDHFKLADKDYDIDFRVSRKIYGREKEISLLKNSIESVKQGTLHTTIIAGYSGVGKSSLVEEINRFENTDTINFLSGKFQQYKSNIPYFALVEAMNVYFDKLLLSKTHILNSFKDNFQKFIGEQGGVLTMVFPKLELIVGKQPSVNRLVGVEAENRFIITFLDFLRLIATPKKPLVLFLDDLQWTDLVSLNILKAIIKNRVEYVFIGLAYRDNEVDHHHPFHYFMEEIIKLNEEVQHIKLQDLKTKDIAELLKDSRIKNSEDLALLIHRKTNGNSFFRPSYYKRYGRPSANKLHSGRICMGGSY